ncbi:hypothetical protein ACP4OV_001520 [Aristida adscensionis]
MGDDSVSISIPPTSPSSPASLSGGGEEPQARGRRILGPTLVVAREGAPEGGSMVTAAGGAPRGGGVDEPEAGQRGGASDRRWWWRAKVLPRAADRRSPGPAARGEALRGVARRSGPTGLQQEENAAVARKGPRQQPEASML